MQNIDFFELLMHSQHDTQTAKIAFASFFVPSIGPCRFGFSPWLVLFGFLIFFFGLPRFGLLHLLHQPLVRINSRTRLQYPLMAILFSSKNRIVAIETLLMSRGSCACYCRCRFRCFLRQASSLIHYVVVSSTSFLHFINKYHVRSILVSALMRTRGEWR